MTNARLNIQDLPSQYDHEAAQAKWYKVWEERGYFHAEPGALGPDGKPKKPYTIVIPPPNVTGALHLGHALNNTLQDILIRQKRMQGFNALWMPGTDHAGIATQAVVERRLLEEEKLSRHDLGREGLVDRIWTWKQQYEKRILGQLKQLGCSCDWQRLRFTLDDQCARAVRETFFRLFKDGKIYRGKRLVNWDTYLQTAVSDDEVFKEPVKGHFWHFKYPVIKNAAWREGDPEFVAIATTRPETMLGDTAVAVHPDPAAAFQEAEDALSRKRLEASEKERAAIDGEIEALRARRGKMLKQLETLRDMAKRGVKLRLPLAEREIPLIADEWAKPELGSGAVKITPAHDENDYAVGQRHPEIGAPINVMNADGTLNDSVPEKYRGLKMHTTARAAVVADMEAAGLFNPETDREDREIELPHSDRSKTPIEPYLADQWFVKMDQLAQSAMDAVSDGRVKIVPDRYGKTYLDWLGEKRDWPVGRQLWWGHRIPVWSRHFESEDQYHGVPMATVENSIHDELSDRLTPLELNYDAVFIRYVRDDDSTRDFSEYRPSDGGFTIYVCVKEDINEAPDAYDLNIVSLMEKAGYTQSEEVLDTWFSSALWPNSTLGWPDQTPELAEFYPTSTLITSRDIITLWVARMVLAGLYNMEEVPFKEVYIHPKILDGYGETMSKSKGNGVDPLDVIEKFGADALRFGLAYLTTETQDVRMPVEFECPHCQHVMAQTKKNRTLTRIDCEKCGQPFRTQWAESHGMDADKALPRGAVVSERFELGRRFCNKIWNASRFSLMNLDDSATTSASEPGRLGPGESQKGAASSQGSGGETPRLASDAFDAGSGDAIAGFLQEQLLLEDRWILSRLATVTREVDAALAAYRFADAARALYEFAWNDFCDYYVEITKARFKEPTQRPVAQRLLAHVLDSLLRLLHPIVPFLTEEVWQLLNSVAPVRGLGAKPQAAVESVCVAEWPAVDAARIDATIEAQFADFQAVLKGVREIRLGQNIPPRTPIQFRVQCPEATAKLLEPMRPYFAQIADATCMELGPQAAAPERAVSKSLGEIEIHVDVSAFFDPAAEKSRLEKEILNLRNHAESLEKKLSNESFVSRAPANVVQQQRDLLAERRGQLAAAEAALVKLK